VQNGEIVSWYSTIDDVAAVIANAMFLMKCGTSTAFELDPVAVTAFVENGAVAQIAY
jgi:hypothetical protein